MVTLIPRIGAAIVAFNALVVLVAIVAFSPNGFLG
jgi:hypothetical protein